MIYAAELFYWQDPNFSFEKGLRVTAETLATFAKAYDARLITPKDKQVLTKQSGLLPEDLTARQTAVRELIDWVLDASAVNDMFSFFLSDETTVSTKQVNLFDHHDDTCCWALNLTEEQFAALKDAWQRHNLPTDLFFLETAGQQIGNYYYTPKQFEAHEAR